jgi:hypothetical protein
MPEYERLFQSTESILQAYVRTIRGNILCDSVIANHSHFARLFSASHLALSKEAPSALVRMIGDMSCSCAASRCGGISESLRMTCRKSNRGEFFSDRLGWEEVPHRSDGEEKGEGCCTAQHILRERG